MQTLTQFKKQMQEEKRSPAPWLKADKQGNSVIQFRFLDELADMPFVRSHYDHRLNRAVRCNRQMFEKKDGSYGFSGQCDYCDKRRALKASFKPTPQQQYAPSDWDMSCSLVSRVAVLNSDGSQTFKLINLKAKDLVYASGKGFYKALDSFTINKAKAKKPTTLKDYWWELNPDWTMLAGERVEDSQMDEVVNGLYDENNQIYDYDNVAPLPYAEALQKVHALESEGSQTEDYDDNDDPGEAPFD